MQRSAQPGGPEAVRWLATTGRADDGHDNTHRSKLAPARVAAGVQQGAHTSATSAHDSVSVSMLRGAAVVLLAKAPCVASSSSARSSGHLRNSASHGAAPPRARCVRLRLAGQSSAGRLQTRAGTAERLRAPRRFLMAPLRRQVAVTQRGHTISGCAGAAACWQEKLEVCTVRSHRTPCARTPRALRDCGPR